MRVWKQVKTTDGGRATIYNPTYDYTKQLFMGLDPTGRRIRYVHPTNTVIRKMAEDVPGWCKSSQGQFLASLVSQTTVEGAYVEIGSWKGRSAVWLGWAMKRRNLSPLYCIDTFDSRSTLNMEGTQTLDDFKRNMEIAGLKDIVKPLHYDSLDLAPRWREPLSFCYIDAGHSYEEVLADYEAWSPHVKTGGIMAFDDVVAWDGPKKLLEELKQSGEWQYLGTVHNGAGLKKL